MDQGYENRSGREEVELYARGFHIDLKVDEGEHFWGQVPACSYIIHTSHQ